MVAYWQSFPIWLRLVRTSARKWNAMKRIVNVKWNKPDTNTASGGEKKNKLVTVSAKSVSDGGKM